MMIHEPVWLVRIIICFEKSSEEYNGVRALPKIELSLLQKQWDIAALEPMIDVYDINERQAKFLNSIVPDLEFDLSKYDYQISAVTTDFDRTKAEGGFMGKYPPPSKLYDDLDLNCFK